MFYIILATVLVLAWTVRYIFLPYLTIKREVRLWESKGLKVYQLPIGILHTSHFMCFLRSIRLHGDPFFIIQNEMRGYDLAIGNNGTKPAIIMLSAQVHQDLYSQNHKVKKSEPVHFYFDGIIGKGLLMATGQKWKRNRMLFTRSFTFDFLIDLTPTMAASFEKAVDRMVEIKTKSKETKSIDIMSFIEQALVEVVMGLFFGIDLAKESIQGKPLGRFVADTFEEGLLRTRGLLFGIFGPWLPKSRILHADRVFQDRVHLERSIASALIKERLCQLDHEEGKQNSILSQLHKDNLIDRGPEFMGLSTNIRDENSLGSSKNGTKIGIQELVDELNTFILAGTDTTSNAVNSTLHMLNENPAVMRKLRCEVQQYARQPLDFATLKKHFYLDAVFKETLRLYNPANRIFLREVSSDSSLTILGHPCANGSHVLLTTGPLHADKNTFPQPDRYFPERWLGVDPKLNIQHSSCSNDQSAIDQSTDSFLTNQSSSSCPFSRGTSQIPSLDPNFRLPLPHTYSYCPFSGGQRNCIGQYLARIQFKLIMITMLRKWKKIENETPRQMKLGLAYGCIGRKYWIEEK